MYTNLAYLGEPHEDIVIKDEPIVITSKHGNKVMISEEDWRAIEETNYLSSIPGMADSIKKAETGDDFIKEEDLEW